MSAEPADDGVVVRGPFTVCKISSDNDDDDEDTCSEEPRHPFIIEKRKMPAMASLYARRMTPPALVPYNPDDDDDGDEAGGPCWSLLGKLRTDDNLTKIITIVLFVIMISFVGIIWIFYQRIEFEIELGREVHFWENTRHLDMWANGDHRSILRGQLGVNIPKQVHAQECFDRTTHDHQHNKFFLRHVDHICLRWIGYGLLKMDFAKQTDNMTSCYHVYWSGLSDEIMDCYQMDGSHWYGGPQTPDRLWPIDQDSERNKTPHVSGDFYKYGIGSVIESYWINSNGVAIRVNRSVPLYSRIKTQGTTPSLCLSTGRGKPPFPFVTKEQTTLEYTVCKSASIVDMHEYMTRSQESEPNIDDVHDSLLKHPSCSVWDSYRADPTAEQVDTFAADLKKWDINCSRLALYGDWETRPGELTFDETKFSDIANISVWLQRDLGILVSIPIHPFIEVSSTELFEMAARNRYFIKSATDEAPALLEIQTSSGRRALGAVINLIDDEPRQWFLDRVLRLKQNHSIPSVHLTLGHVTWLPEYGRLGESVVNPSEFTYHYAQLATQLGIDTTTLSAAFHNHNLNSIIYITDRTLTWASNTSGLRSIIPTVLDLSLKGYRFPALRVGCQIHLPEKGEIPSKELYVRTVQLAAFLPSFELSVMPWMYDSEVLSITKSFIALHRDYITPIVLNLAKEKNLSVVRPMWMVDPTDENLFVITDQFMVGDDLLVAPVVHEGQVNRDVYLPRGRWLDKNLGVEVTGERWLRKYAVPLRHTAYFLRIDALYEGMYRYTIIESNLENKNVA